MYAANGVACTKKYMTLCIFRLVFSVQFLMFQVSGSGISVSGSQKVVCDPRNVKGRCRANMAHVRQSRRGSGLGLFHLKVHVKTPSSRFLLDRQRLRCMVGLKRLLQV